MRLAQPWWRFWAVVLGGTLTQSCRHPDWIECNAVFIVSIISRHICYLYELYLTLIWPCPLTVASCHIDILISFLVYCNLLDLARWKFESKVVLNLFLNCGCWSFTVVSRSSQDGDRAPPLRLKLDLDLYFFYKLLLLISGSFNTAAVDLLLSYLLKLLLMISWHGLKVYARWRPTATISGLKV